MRTQASVDSGAAAPPAAGDGTAPGSRPEPVAASAVGQVGVGQVGVGQVGAGRVGGQIGDMLRRLHGAVLAEPMPARFLDLLQQMDLKADPPADSVDSAGPPDRADRA